MVNSNHLLNKYLTLYKRNPKSKVFAPLAESYRKLGLFEDAYEVIKKGLKFHPTYVLGFVVLAHLYYDEGKYELAYSTLHSLAIKNRDNISMQRLFGDICLKLSQFDEALETFKYVLFLNPTDQYAIKHVKELEDDLAQKAELEIESRRLNRQQFKLEDDIFIEDSWEQVDLNQIRLDSSSEESLENKTVNDTTEVQSANDSESIDQWELQAPTNDNIEKLKKEVKTENIKIHEKGLEDKFFEAEEYTDPRLHDAPEAEKIILPDDAKIKSEDKEESSQGGSPFINHTLVDLYLSQGHNDKAIEVLEKILILHPEDDFTRKRIEELRLKREEIVDFTIQEKDDGVGEDSLTRINEQDQHEKLINLVEKNVGYQKDHKKLQKFYMNFLQGIKDRGNIN